MQFLEKFNLKPALILKGAGLALVGIIVLAIGIRLVGSSFDGFIRKSNLSSPSSMSKSTSFGADYEEATDSYSGGVGLSARNVAPSPPIGEPVTTGSDAEDFEVTKYDGTIETRDLKATCSKIAGLKAKDYVIFENANEYDQGCNYVFKVEREHAEEIFTVVKELDPKNLIENTHTIKRRIDDFTSEAEILEKKLKTVEDTLASAIVAYDEITQVARSARDAESLSKIIDSKLKMIERLSQERINISVQLDRLSRSKAEQLDRLDYTYFYLNIYETKYIDGERLKDSWKNAIKKFVYDVNRISQELSIGLVTVILIVLEYALYLLLVIIFAKYGWRLVKRIWNK